jgi:hypothetical protein
VATSSRIEWTEQTWNPSSGCSKVSPGCVHCYAEVMARRLAAIGLARTLLSHRWLIARHWSLGCSRRKMRSWLTGWELPIHAHDFVSLRDNQARAHQNAAEAHPVHCSICRRYGAIWAYYRRRAVVVLCPGKALSVYVWGNKTLQFHRCKKCGSVTHHENANKRPDGSDWLAVNVRNIDQTEVIARIPIRLLDGASTWKVLGEHIQPGLFYSPVARRKNSVRDAKRSRANRSI